MKPMAEGVMPMQHPDITAALRDGYPDWESKENRDTHENRAAYFEERASELLKWLLSEHSEILDEFINDHDRDYWEWLN